MLKAVNLSIGYGNNKVINNFDLTIDKGDLITIIGVNGCGKSTLLKSLSRSLKPLKGVVYLDGQSIFRLDTKKVARRLSILPQAPKVPEDFTVRDLVSYGRQPYLGLTGKLKRQDHEVIDWAISATRIDYLQHRPVNTLSGGERQRAWLALALAQQPEVLLLDEPTTFLDVSCQFEVLELVKALNSILGITIVMVLHDINQAARYSKHMVVLKDGNVYRSGTPEEIVTEKVLEEVFNIKVRVFSDPDNNCPYFIPVRGNSECAAALDLYKK
ncbi:putative siderophore transport system ATP-binding protein YusV [Oxobacter pfennigii]|uniref:Putative siderophore transport system ATP-binding protein YusV n=1 Tax=Oxobacter pfennigii TaxID=36849 RepID=A0A0P8W475_9CLOT|nr:ABC transporter ATP-binding protein [Oxobacter pfennigii]KPU43385.1 putative siderophore transport system ATP-binding protein YusV [Oxobacter pfennigii]